jgi:hypothetical protein
MAVRPHLRLLAMAADGFLGLLLSLILATSPIGHFFSARAVTLLRIGQPDSWFQGPAAMVIGMMGELVFVMPLGFALALMPEALVAWGLGKRLVRIRIAGTDGRSLALRYLIKTMPLWLSVIALLSGLWVIEQLAMVAAVVLIPGLLRSLFGSASALHDRVAGTQLEG